MAHSYHHAISSAKRYGGAPDDYVAIHAWMDSSKSAWADQRHRAVLHQNFGIYLTEEVFGLREEVRLLHAALDRLPRWVRRLFRLEIPQTTPVTIRISSGRQIPIRFIAEQHVIEDCGFIPSLQDYLGEMPRQKWMYRGAAPLSKMLETEQPLPALVNPGGPTTTDLEPLAPLPSHVTT